MKKVDQVILDRAMCKTEELSKEVKKLKKELEITHEFKGFINNFESIYLKNLTLENTSNISRELESNKEKDLQLYYKFMGKQVYVKSFGKIKTIEKTKLVKIIKLVMLLKIIKQINSDVIDSSLYLYTETYI